MDIVRFRNVCDRVFHDKSYFFCKDLHDVLATENFNLLRENTNVLSKTYYRMKITSTVQDLCFTLNLKRVRKIRKHKRKTQNNNSIDEIHSYPVAYNTKCIIVGYEIKTKIFPTDVTKQKQHVDKV